MTATIATPDLIQTITDNGGFTYDPTANALIEVGSTTGYAIAVPGTEHVVGTADVTREAFIAAVADLITTYADKFAAGAVLGGWFSEDRGVYLVELSMIFRVSREFAVEIGQILNQEAIFDLATGETIPTGGHGDA